jgi:hypothetical protein
MWCKVRPPLPPLCSADFFCPVKKCLEFACEANFRKSAIPEYKREYEEIENRYSLTNKVNVNDPVVLIDW